jgi:hypothetical protein
VDPGLVSFHSRYGVSLVVGVAIQMYQLKAYHEKRSTWKIKDEVLGYTP